jgi:cytochrome o ubiquinol oxidase operon protein cyoD
MTTHTYFEKIGLLPHTTRPAWIGYGLGFIASILLTTFAYAVATQHMLMQREALALIVLFACAQFFVQAVSFLHLGWGISSRERSIVFIVTTFVVAILVSGSIWIITSLNDRMMPSTQHMEEYMGKQPLL